MSRLSFEYLRYNTTQRKLNLCYIKLFTDKIIHLADVLSTNTTLEILDLAGCEIEGNDAIPLGKIHVRKLILRKNNISLNSLRSILSNTNLESLVLSECPLNDSFIPILAHSNLVKLDISYCNLSSEGTRTLCTKLISNRTLEKLTLTPLNVDDVPKLIKGSSTLTSLTSRPICQNITPDELMGLIDALESNTTLKFLHLFTKFTDVDFNNFVEIFRTNNTLELLKLANYGQITAGTIDKLLICLESNYSFQSLHGYYHPQLHHVMSDEVRLKKYQRFSCIKRAY